jgi:hypothetical protein
MRAASPGILVQKGLAELSTDSSLFLRLAGSPVSLLYLEELFSKFFFYSPGAALDEPFADVP